MKFLDQIKNYIKISGVAPISRRYFIMNAFDGATTVLGVVVGCNNRRRGSSNHRGSLFDTLFPFSPWDIFDQFSCSNLHSLGFVDNVLVGCDSGENIQPKHVAAWGENVACGRDSHVGFLCAKANLT